MTPTIRRKLEQLAERFEEVGALIAQPDAAADTNRFHALNREYAQLEPVAAALKAYDANDAALESWGRFRDGAVIVDERAHARLDEQKTWEEAGLAHVAVMRKDHEHYPDTGGWYFNIFVDGDTTTGLAPGQAKARCFDACHRTQEARDFVFSDPRR